MNRPRPFIQIAGRTIGPGHPTYIIAEVSANHSQDISRAIDMIHAAKAAGADAVKIQTYTADTLTIDSEKPPFIIGGGTPWDSRTLYDLYKEAYTPWEWHAELKAVADGIGIHLFSTPFDPTAVELLEELGMPAHKIASFELVDLPLIRRVAATGKPMIMSTGMATLEEIEEAVTTARSAGAQQIALLKCTSAYPSPPEEMNLHTIADLARRFELPVGLSDHTLGATAPIAAVALGACIIEKHFTLSRSEAGVDSSFSAEPHELAELVSAVSTTEAALGKVAYGPQEHEKSSMVFRRSLFVVEDMRAGDAFTSKNVRSIRPGFGLHTRHLDEVIGRIAKTDLERGTPLAWEMID